MLALQLHKAPRPNLNAGAFFVPIMRWQDRVWKDPDFDSWKSPHSEMEALGGSRGPWGFWTQFKGGDGAYRGWMRVLKVASGRATYRNTEINYISLVRIPPSHRVHMETDWVNRMFGMLDMPLADIPARIKRQIAGEHTQSELVLHERLPASCLLWTKDWRLLRGGGGKAPQGPKKSRGGRLRGSWSED
jgi:hypothetical protein